MQYEGTLERSSSQWVFPFDEDHVRTYRRLNHHGEGTCAFVGAAIGAASRCWYKTAAIKAAASMASGSLPFKEPAVKWSRTKWVV